MAAREATVRLPKPLAEGALRLRIEVGDAMAPDILDSLSLRVNGHPARLTTATGRPSSPLIRWDLLPVTVTMRWGNKYV